MTDLAATETSPDLGPGAGLRCPLCEYDLRGLAEPRCPECGYTFDWAELREAVRLHPYLFEHHPNQNFASFWQTLLGGWRAKQFWVTLRPTHKPRPLRLAAYAIVVALPAWLVPVSVLATLAIETAAATFAVFLGFLPNLFQYRQTRQLLFTTAVLVLWPWVTLGALMIFQATLRRAAVRKVHVVRCAVYACDATFAASLALLAAAGLAAVSVGSRWIYSWDQGVLTTMRVLILGLPPVVAWRLGRACGLYLRIPQAVAVAVLTQVIVLLLLLNFAFREQIFSWPNL